MKHIAILANDQGAFFELGCAIEVFGLPRPEYENWYQCDVVSFTQGPLNFTSGIQIHCKVIESLDDYNMLVIPSWPTNKSKPSQQLIEEVLSFHKKGKRIISYCSGAFLLGEAGILNERDATTHWKYAERFKKAFPKTHYLDDVLYVYDGLIGCSAGSAAALDLSIEVVRSDYGYKIANQVARRLVLSSHRKGGQSQFVETPMLAIPNRFSETLDWALNNLSSAIDINTLARKANMSRRTFDRKFKTTFNLSPNSWLINQRLTFAKQLLEEKKYAIEKVAQMSGFGNSITMRHHFNKSYGISPKQYKQQF
ncbi:transcriptional regulator FtrA [Aurantivibrio infirmus]